jgi:hypothetical protein
MASGLRGGVGPPFAPPQAQQQPPRQPYAQRLPADGRKRVSWQVAPSGSTRAGDARDEVDEDADPDGDEWRGPPRQQQHHHPQRRRPRSSGDADDGVNDDDDDEDDDEDDRDGGRDDDDDDELPGAPGGVIQLVLDSDDDDDAAKDGEGRDAGAATAGASAQATAAGIAAAASKRVVRAKDIENALLDDLVLHDCAPLPADAAGPAPPAESAAPSAAATAEAPPPVRVCAHCGALPKYTCPRCGVRSCSVACVRAHKAATKCSGVADAGQFVPLARFTGEQLRRDLRFVTACQRVVDNCQRGLERTWRYNFRALPPPLHALREAAKQRGVLCQITSEGMTKRAQNTSRFDRLADSVIWHVEFAFCTGLAPTHAGAALDRSAATGPSATAASVGPRGAQLRRVQSGWTNERFLLRDAVLACWATNPRLPKYSLARRRTPFPGGQSVTHLASLSGAGAASALAQQQQQRGRGFGGRGRWMPGRRGGRGARGRSESRASTMSRYVAPTAADAAEDGGGAGDEDENGSESDDAAPVADGNADGDSKRGASEGAASADAVSSAGSSGSSGSAGDGARSASVASASVRAPSEGGASVVSAASAAAPVRGPATGGAPFAARALYWSSFDGFVVGDARAKSLVTSLLDVKAVTDPDAAAAPTARTHCGAARGELVVLDSDGDDDRDAARRVTRAPLVPSVAQPSLLQNARDVGRHGAHSDGGNCDDDAPRERSARLRAEGLVDDDDDATPSAATRAAQAAAAAAAAASRGGSSPRLIVSSRPFAVFAQLERAYGGVHRDERRYMRLHPLDSVCNAMRKIFFISEFPTLYVVPLPATEQSDASDGAGDMPPVPEWVHAVFPEANAEEIRAMRATFSRKRDDSQPGDAMTATATTTTTTRANSVAVSVGEADARATPLSESFAENDAAAVAAAAPAAAGISAGDAGGDVDAGRSRDDASAPEVPRPPRDLSRIPCRNFLRGSCYAAMRGEVCPMLHCAPDEVPLCRAMSLHGECPHGERCSFAHDATKLRAVWAQRDAEDRDGSFGGRGRGRGRGGFDDRGGFRGRGRGGFDDARGFRGRGRGGFDDGGGFRARGRGGDDYAPSAGWRGAEYRGRGGAHEPRAPARHDRDWQRQ